MTKTYVRKICMADVVKHWGSPLRPLSGDYHYAICSKKGKIQWNATRLVTADESLKKNYKLLK